MDGMIDKVTLEELRIFHGLDRKLYTILVCDLSRNSSECLYVMGFWLWLECEGFTNIISKILSLQHILINEVCNEALTCLSIIFDTQQSSTSQIPLTHRLLNVHLSLNYFRENRLAIYHRVYNIVSDVYILALADIMERARLAEFSRGPARIRSVVSVPSTPGYTGQARAVTYEDMVSRSFSGMSVGGGSGAHQASSQLSRTMFVTFSKGYPVMESELREFFMRLFGNCIESLWMQEVVPDEQPLYARIIFVSPAYIQFILNGEIKVKFSINGKHVWMREFVPRNGRIWPCGCPTVGAAVCPHQY